MRFQLARKMPARLLIGSPTGGQAAHFQGSAGRRTGGPGGRASTSFEIVCWSSCFFDAFPLSPSCHRLARLAAALSFNSSFPTILSASRYADLPSEIQSHTEAVFCIGPSFDPFGHKRTPLVNREPDLRDYDQRQLEGEPKGESTQLDALATYKVQHQLALRRVYYHNLSDHGATEENREGDRAFDG